MKKKNLVSIFALALSLGLFAACSQSILSKDPGEGLFDPWDNLNGGGTAVGGEISDEKAEDYAPSTTTLTDEQKATGTSGATAIDLSALTADNAPTGTAFADGTLTISTAGVYALSGSMVGNVVVKNTDGTVRLVLNGANISTPSTSVSAAVVFEKTSALRVLTVANGTRNVLSDSAGDTDAAGDGAAIQAKKCSLTVNGGGTLVLKGVGENASGLKVKKELTVLGTKMEIEAVNNGIKADEKIFFFNADLQITAGGDGVKTDKEASDAEEAAEFANDPEAGYIYIENTSFDITAGDDGISANNCLYISNTDSDTVKVRSGGGAPTKVTETSSDNADGKALKADGITLVEGETETDIPASYEANYALVITGGKFELDSNDDAITSKGHLLITGGTFTVATGDDGLHAEYLTKISGGNITVSKSYEGVEGGAVEIMGGTVSVVAVDDGINAANPDLRSYDYHIYIGGGATTVNADGDGVDSNGWFQMEGGKLTIHGPTSRDNGSLDSEKGILVNGGDLIAVGSAGMVENPASNSEQCYISVNLSSSQAAGTAIKVYDESGTLLTELSPQKSYQSVIISLSAFEKEKTYTVTIGSNTYEATLSSTGTALGSNQSGGGNQGYMPGGAGGPGGPGGR